MCDENQVGDLSHSLLHCKYNDGAGELLKKIVSPFIPNVRNKNILLFNFHIKQEERLPTTFLIAFILSEVWKCRSKKKSCKLLSIRANLEAEINILRKSRHKDAAHFLLNLLLEITE